MKKLFLLLLLLLTVFPVEARILLDVPVKKPAKEAVAILKPLKSYPDVPEDHWAREAIDELVEAGILDPGIGRPFWGEDPVDRFRLTYFLARMLEKLLLEKGELELADASLSYKDVNPINPAYRSIQKLIALGTLTPGFRREVFNGTAIVNRYQLVYFLFTPLENLLSAAITFPEANPAEGFPDVPQNHFAYPTIQKLLRLEVLSRKGTFDGDQPATRYFMADISVKILKQVYLKIKEAEAIMAPRPEYGFRTLLSTNFSAIFTQAGKGDTDLLNLAGVQNVNLTVDRTLTADLSAYLSLENQFYFGKITTPPYLGIGETYLTMRVQPHTYQLGRSTGYFSYSPFGASLFLDSRVDAITLDLAPHWGHLTGYLGKLTYQGDITADSNFASILLSLNPFSRLEIALGCNFVNDPLDPAGATQLPTRIQQPYGGIKLNLAAFEIAFESSRVDFSNQEVLPLVGTTDEVDTSASQVSFSYYSPEHNYILSIGYQHLGDDFYNANLANPAVAANSGLGKNVWLIKSRANLSEEETLNTNLNLIYQGNQNIENNAGFLYSRRLFKLAYLNLGANGVIDPMDFSKLKSLSASGSISLSF